MPHVEVYRQRGVLRRWRWRRVANNGRIIADSGQGYTRRWSAKRAARRSHPSDEVRVLS